RSKEGTGSIGSNVFVYYSDNKKPEIIIKSPVKDEVLNGFVTVTGTVSDEVGLESFSYILDKEEVPIPLITGNPYWSHTFDLKERKSAKITFLAVDLSGNSQSYKLDLKLDNKADLPQIGFLDSNDKKVIENIDPALGLLKGVAFDDDGIESILYSIDKSEFNSIKTNGPFIIPLDGFDPGVHTVSLYAVDMYGVEGAAVKYTFKILNTPPEISINTYTADKAEELFRDGAVFKQGKTAKIAGTVSGGEGSLTGVLKIGNRDEISVKISGGMFLISLPKDFEEGGYNLELTVRDTLERSAVFTTRVYFLPQQEKGQEFQTYRPEKKDGIFIEDSRLKNGDIANISTERPLSGYITGHTVTEEEVSPAVVDTENPKNSKEAVFETIITMDKIKSATLEPEQDNFRINTDGTIFSIVPVSESEPVIFRVRVETIQGKEYLSDEITSGSDSARPDLSVNNIFNSVLSDSLHLSGTLSDNIEIKRTNIEFSGSADSYGSSRSLKNELDEDPNIFDMEIDLLSIPEGDHFYTLTVTDIYGNINSKTVPFIIDRSPAELTIIQPEPDISVEGIITVSGKIENFINQGKLSFSENGLDFVDISVSGDNAFSFNIDLSKNESNPDNFIFQAVDRGGNISVLKPDFTVNREADRPSVSIEIPAANTTIRDNFNITGLVFDDDEVGSIFYSMDNGEFLAIEGDNYFNIPYSLESLNDGEHTITVRAADSGGFMSKDAVVSFLVSKAEPVSLLISPEIEFYTTKTIVLNGQTYDENGIDSVFISYDNGITFNKAILEEAPAATEEAETAVKIPTTVNWNYVLDTKLPGDGTHSILIKAVDNAGTVGISSTIVNIDNTAPEIKLDYPEESESLAGSLVIDGKVFDGTRVKSVIAELKSLNEIGDLVSRNIETDDVFREVIDLESYDPGWYNLTVTVTDYADNSISETRNFEIIPLKNYKSIDLYFPEEGKSVVGSFVVEGQMNYMPGVKKAVLRVDDQILQTADVLDNGLFSFSIGKEDLSDGIHLFSVESSDTENKVVSDVRNITYISEGAWVQVDNIISGQFVSGRPMITGTAGYNGSESGDKSKRVKRVEISLDNGKSFTDAKGRETWQFRLETYDLPEGINQIIIRSTLEDGDPSVTKLFVNVDETPPDIKLLFPEENRKFNGSVSLVGTAGDINGLDSVEVLIREGGKERYEVPSFVQGLYVDFHALGATYGEIGVGLSFFDDVVKLQAQVGISPPGRFSGLVIGGKLLANIIDIPFSYFFGYDWEFFSMSVAVGANFNYFTMSDNRIEFTDKGVVLGSVLAQFEFAKFDIKDLKIFNKYSLYLEGSLWFISSDVQAGIVPTFSVGTRIGIF
ncbi:MAG: Ig-like domain-containing protein, partial [Spirochaetales bacterium]|nr:Ig-like domain-containing protein [Spirochaetales bacterium]